MRGHVIFSICLALITAVGGYAADAFVEVEAWSEFDPIVADGSERPIPREVVLERLLNEIQFTVSGMVYGYRFEYVPGDSSRGVAESFTLEPFASIVRGDRALTVYQTWVDGDRLVARVGYEVHPEQMAWFEGWHSGATARSTGTGTSSLFLGPSKKTDAVSDAVRDAVRQHVREQVFNRPLRITGAALLADDPLFSVYHGNYQATVDVLLQIDDIEAYTTY